jgi:hypothetical protein
LRWEEQSKVAGKTVEQLREEAAAAWSQLQKQLRPDIVHAPQLDWSQVHPHTVIYLARSVQGKPWVNHLAFLTVILTSYTKLDPGTIRGMIYMIHKRFCEIFSRYQINSVLDWKPREHLPRYMNDTELPDGLSKRQEFLYTYSASARYCTFYLRTLPENEQSIYRQWALPDIPKDFYSRISRADILSIERQQRRKEKTDALAPHYARIRGESHLRWNQLKRLRDKYYEVVARVSAGQETLPVSFSYEEQSLGKRLHFKLWDRYTFAEKHADQYHRCSRGQCRRRVGSFAPEKNNLFLEFTQASSLEDGSQDSDALLWFGDLLRYNLLGHAPLCGTAEEIQQAQAYLRNWGYGKEEDEALLAPFRSSIAGLLAWPKAQIDFLREAQKRTPGLIFLVEPLYAAATFGLAILDFCTTTGARIMWNTTLLLRMLRNIGRL